RGLRVAGLEDAFQVIVGADEVTHPKPHPEPVLTALERLGAPATGAVFVGDSRHDVECGRAAGVKTAAVLWGPFDRSHLEELAPEQILVTTGSAEANFVVCWRLVEPGDKVAVMLPNYLQTWGLAQNFGAQVRGFTLRAEAAWEPSPDEVRSAIAAGTKLVVVTNPHNPTGHVLSTEMRQAIVSRAAEVG